MKSKSIKKNTLAYKIGQYKIQEEVALLFISLFFLFIVLLYLVNTPRLTDQYDKIFVVGFLLVVIAPIFISIRSIVKKFKKHKKPE